MAGFTAETNFRKRLSNGQRSRLVSPDNRFFPLPQSVQGKQTNMIAICGKLSVIGSKQGECIAVAEGFRV